MPLKIAIFASGSGTNAENIMHYFKNNPDITVSYLYTNKSGAKVREKAKQHNVADMVFSKDDLYNSNKVLDHLRENTIDFIVLAGFMWLVPSHIINAYTGRMINIHPALLPTYGGKGMYGSKVHKAVIANGETKSGISIHYANEYYDEGDLILQAFCTVYPNDSAEELAERVHKLEYRYYPVVIEDLLSSWPLT